MIKQSIQDMSQQLKRKGGRHMRLELVNYKALIYGNRNISINFPACLPLSSIHYNRVTHYVILSQFLKFETSFFFVLIIEYNIMPKTKHLSKNSKTCLHQLVNFGCNNISSSWLGVLCFPYLSWSCIRYKVSNTPILFYYAGQVLVSLSSRKMNFKVSGSRQRVSNSRSQ